jgi:hypothetical protein
MAQQIGFEREVSALKTRILASITLWLAAVASVAGIAWLAIDTAGHQVTAVSISAPITPDFPDQTTAPAVPSPSSAGPSATAKPSPGRSRPSPRSTRTASGQIKSAGSGSGAQPTATAVAGTYSTYGGRIRVSCSGAQITLDGGYAQPAPGWSVRVRFGGPDQVKVLFEFRDKRTLVVVAVCAGGRPQFDQYRVDGGSHPNSDD